MTMNKSVQNNSIKTQQQPKPSIKIIELKELKRIQPDWKKYIETHELVVFYNPDCPYSKRALVVLEQLVQNNCLKDVIEVTVLDWNFVYNDLAKYKGVSTLPQIFTKHKEKGIIVTDSTTLIDAFMGNKKNCTIKTVLFGAAT